MVQFYVLCVDSSDRCYEHTWPVFEPSQLVNRMLRGLPSINSTFMINRGWHTIPQMLWKACAWRRTCQPGRSEFDTGRWWKCRILPINDNYPPKSQYCAWFDGSSQAKEIFTLVFFLDRHNESQWHVSQSWWNIYGSPRSWMCQTTRVWVNGPARARSTLGELGFNVFRRFFQIIPDHMEVI